jgi:signal transduction histidine kinase
VRFRFYIALVSVLLIFTIIVVISGQTRRILDRGFQELGTAEVIRANAIVQAVVKSKRDNLTSFKKLIAADEEIAKSLKDGQLLVKLQEIKELGKFDFVDFIFPNGNSAYGNEKRFGNGAHVDETLDADRLSVVQMNGDTMLLSFCTKKKSEIGMLVLGYQLSGRLEKRLSELTGSNVKFMTSEAGEKNIVPPKLSVEGATFFEISRFPLRSLMIEITLDRSIFGNIDLKLQKSLLYSGGLSLFILLFLLYLLFEVGFVRRFQTILSSIKIATYKMEAGDIPEVEFQKHPVSELQWMSRAFFQFSQSIKLYDEKIKEQAAASARIENQAALANFAQQVAHDLRSPLATLEMFVDTYDQLPIEPRNLMKGCISRALDVANTLLDKCKTEAPNLSEDEADILDVPREVYLISSLIEPIVSEKRVQYKKKAGLQIRTEFNADSYGLFVLLSALRFKRILSNIIDNAVEAIGESGKIVVRLSPVGSDHVSIVVEDNGPGIAPDLLPKLGTRGITFGKSAGNGLGLHHAKTVIETVGGAFNIFSKLGEGTKVEGVLARAASPDWFVKKLSITPRTQIIVLDDDPSIHHLWDERFKTAGVKLLHFLSPNDLEKWQKQGGFDSSTCLFLCDYEIIGDLQNGLDVIEKLGIQRQAYLVTSHFENNQIRKRAAKLGVQLIPKFLARFVPISVGD